MNYSNPSPVIRATHGCRSGFSARVRLGAADMIRPSRPTCAASTKRRAMRRWRRAPMPIFSLPSVIAACSRKIMTKRNLRMDSSHARRESQYHEGPRYAKKLGEHDLTGALLARGQPGAIRQRRAPHRMNTPPSSAGAERSARRLGGLRPRDSQRESRAIRGTPSRCWRSSPPSTRHRRWRRSRICARPGLYRASAG